MTENNTVNANKKATILQAVKAIAVLVVICLVCCLLLALCNDLLYISPEEKLGRKIAKIYPGIFTVDNNFDKQPNSKFAKESYGEILQVYKSTDGDYVLQSKGNGGYNEGSVTLYVAIDAKKETIVGWAIESESGQTLISNITQKHQQQWYVGTRVDGDLSMGNNKVAQTTRTSNAINNAIRMAANYCTKALGMGVDYEGEAKSAVIAWLTSANEQYADYQLQNYEGLFNGKYDGKTLKAILSDNDNQLSYYFRAGGALGNVQAFVYGTDNNRKVVVVDDQYQIVAKSDNVDGTEQFVTNILTNKVYVNAFGGSTRYAYILSSSTEGNVTTYTVVGLKIGTEPNNYILVIEIKEAQAGGYGEVVSATLSTDPNGDGFVPGYPSPEDANNLINSGALVGATLATIDSIRAENKKANATQSADLIAIAVKAALADFDANLLHA